MKNIVAAIGLVAAVPLVALAQSASRPAPGAPATGSAHPGMTLQAFQARHERKLLAADTDGDGRVSRAEFLAAAKAGRGDPAKRFAKLDRNGDGYLDKGEVDAMVARRFKRLDADGNGVVTAQERAAAKMAKGGSPRAGDAS